MKNKLDPDDRLFVGNLQGFHSFQGGGFSILSMIIITLFILVTLLGVYVVYDTLKKDMSNN